MTMHWLPVGLIFLFAGLVTLPASANILPNPNCTYNNTVLQCNNVDLPGNFSVASIPQNVTEINLGSECRAAIENFQCNVLGEDVTPYPSSLASLKAVVFVGFRSGPGDDIPFNVIGAFLDNVKGHLMKFPSIVSIHQKLSIVYSKLQKLESRQFKGYRKLQILFLVGTGIQDLSAEVFSEMTDPGSAPALAELSLANNAITSFDWGTLRPIAASLQTIILTGQNPGLQRLFRSSPLFTLPYINHIQLCSNKLTTVPKVILDTIPGTERFAVSLMNNPFCSESADCSCCAMRDLVEWMSSLAQKRANFTMHMDCGSTNQETLSFALGFSEWNLPDELTRLPEYCP